MIRELNSTQIQLVSGGSNSGQSFLNGVIGGAAGWVTDKGVQQAAARVGLSALRGAATGGVLGILVGAAVGVGLEILFNKD